MSDPRHDALEDELLRRYDQLHQPGQGRRFAWKSLAAVAVLLLGLGTALAAPAQYLAEVGKRIQIRVENPAKDVPAADEVPRVLQEAGTRITVEAGARRGRTWLEYDYQLWGDGIAHDLEARLRSAFPALSKATITVSSIEGHVHTTLAGVLEKKLLQAGDDPVKLEAARREVQAELERRNPGAEVEVEAGPGEARVKVMEDKRR